MTMRLRGVRKPASGIEYEPMEPVLDIDSAIRQMNLLGPGRTMRRGDPDAALRSSPRVIRGELRTGAQEHWYLESQACLCIPGEGGEITAFSSTQHPSETQAIIAEVLGLRKNDVVVEVRRLGGGFGGKETQANHVAAWAALLARASGRPVKIRLFRDDDMIITGKRHRYLIRYEAGFDDDGMIQAVKFELNSDGGMASDLSFADHGTGDAPCRQRVLRSAYEPWWRGCGKRIFRPTPPCAGSAARRPWRRWRRFSTAWPASSGWMPRMCGAGIFTG